MLFNFHASGVCISGLHQPLYGVCFQFNPWQASVFSSPIPPLLSNGYPLPLIKVLCKPDKQIKRVLLLLQLGHQAVSHRLLTYISLSRDDSHCRYIGGRDMIQRSSKKPFKSEWEGMRMGKDIFLAHT